eukprot:CAMPEP_0172907624 /NCGR_PEP_ID=MMETSP1075-20121228/179203_1 /TAXON_ID=2916 /ORGANISM="Ceratium fusus, Strain PA161109" /LENGTH=215 /DNA_ID=CAMNT_0013765269 /DNA_START=17 /DNA_END=661 /DNA_ORIENTATION=+
MSQVSSRIPTRASSLHQHTEGKIDMVKSSSDSALLCGVSQTVQHHNARAKNGLDALVAPQPGHVPDSLSGRRTIASSNLMRSEEQRFDAVTRNLKELWAAHDGFDPRNGAGTAQQPGTRSGQRGNAMAGYEGDHLAGRLEAYKMVRRIEPALPPLSRDALASLHRPDQSIVIRNTAPEMLQRWHPQSKRDRTESKREDRESRLQAAADRVSDKML